MMSRLISRVVSRLVDIRPICGIHPSCGVCTHLQTKHISSPFHRLSHETVLHRHIRHVSSDHVTHLGVTNHLVAIPVRSLCDMPHSTATHIVEQLSDIFSPQCVDMAQTSEVVGALLVAGIKHRDIVHHFTLHKNMAILQQDLSTLTLTLSDLSQLGYRPVQLLPAVAMVTQLGYQDNLDQLRTILDTLRALGLQDGVVQKLTLRHPKLASHPPRQLLLQYNELLELLPKVGLMKILERQTMLLVAPLGDIQRNYAYVAEVMRIPPAAMLESDFLFHDFLHVFSRHQTLYRAGLYTTPDKHGGVEKNASLAAIMDTPDREFAEKVATISLEEYTTFIDICQQELQEQPEQEQSHQENMNDP